MRVEASRWARRRRRGEDAVAAAVRALRLLTVVAVALPAGAHAGQSSQATTAPAAQVAAGLYHSCALLDDGAPAPAGRQVRCWGFTGDGQVGYGNLSVIGDDEVPAAAGPVDLGAGRTAAALAAGDYHSCAVLDTGNVRCWGYGNEGQLGYGNRNQVGDNETPGSVGPVDVGAGRTATTITAGGNHTCAVLDNGSVRCWGLGEFGQLGTGGTASIGDGERPGDVAPVNLSGRTATAVTAGLSHTCAILDDATVRCWGVGGNGQLGYGSTSAVIDPAQVTAPVNLGTGRTARAITAGAAHTCAILDDFSVRCWGLNNAGQLGYANTTSIGDNEAPGSAGPVSLGAGRTASAISAGGDHTCAVLDNGTLRCWGSGLFGQLGTVSLDDVGNNEVPSAVAPVSLGAGRTATAVAAGIYHTCARLDDRGVRCWGNGADGRLGHCSRENVGDDEAPGTLARVDLGAGGIACPASPAPVTPVTTPGSTVETTAPPDVPQGEPAAAAAAAAPASGDAAALAAERRRAREMDRCLGAVRVRQRRDRARALRRYGRGTRGRGLALRRAGRQASAGRTRCRSRFARTPGRVTTLAASAVSASRIVLTFRAPGSDGSAGPAARRYLVTQSTRQIRTARDFRRAHALCRGTCGFNVTQVGASVTLQVTQLRADTTYYYAIAALDNVSRRVGPRSSAVRATTR